MDNNDNNDNNKRTTTGIVGGGLAESKPLRTFPNTPAGVSRNNVTMVRSSPLVSVSSSNKATATATSTSTTTPEAVKVSLSSFANHQAHPLEERQQQQQQNKNDNDYVHNNATTTAALDRRIAIHAPTATAGADVDGIEVVRDASPAQSPAAFRNYNNIAPAPAPVSAPLPQLRQKLLLQQQQQQQIMSAHQVPIAKATETTLDEDVDAFLAGGPCTFPAPVPDDVIGLQRLYAYAKRRAWGDVLSVTTDMLGSSTSPYQPFYAVLCDNAPRDVNKDGDATISRLKDETYEIISLRIRAFMVLKRHSDLKKEIQRLQLIGKDYVPFSLRILAAKSMHHFASPPQCLDTLYSLCESSSSNTAKIQTLSMISDVFIAQNEYRLALHSLDEILVMLKEDAMLSEVSALAGAKGALETFGADENGAVADVANGHFCSALLAASRIEILSRQGRMLMQTGALTEASTVFQYAQDEIPPILSALNAANKSSVIRNILSGVTIIHQAPKQLIVNEGILLFADGEYALAMDKFRAVMEAQRQESKLQTHGTTGHLENWLTVNDSLIPPALNNMALCALYTCQLEKAISLMESLVRENPSRYLTQELAFNLCTMYELGSDVGGRRKRVLQLIAKRFSLHDVPQASFRSN